MQSAHLNVHTHDVESPKKPIGFYPRTSSLILSTINSPINFKLFKQIKMDSMCIYDVDAYTYVRNSRMAYCDCNYKALTIMVAQVN